MDSIILAYAVLKLTKGYWFQIKFCEVILSDLLNRNETFIGIPIFMRAFCDG